MTILIGTQGWNYAAWVGPFYPPGTRAAEFLPTYARAFRGVEVDSTFYAVPDVRAVRAWAERTPPDFTFALKMPREVTHELRLRNADDLVRDFLNRARELEQKLGPVLLQMGPDFGPDELPVLEQFLPGLPRDLRFALELRQSRWMRSDVLPHLLEVLAGHGIALGLSDGRWIRRETMLELAERATADFLYVRWMGAGPRDHRLRARAVRPFGGDPRLGGGAEACREHQGDLRLLQQSLRRPQPRQRARDARSPRPAARRPGDIGRAEIAVLT